jgi:putative transposase
VVADRWFPSSKTCSVCGTIQENMPLAVRQWTCPDCGSVHDRDVNAAINLKRLAVSSTVSACGEEGSGADRKVGVKPASKKQAISFEPV